MASAHAFSLYRPTGELARAAFRHLRPPPPDRSRGTRLAGSGPPGTRPRPHRRPSGPRHQSPAQGRPRWHSRMRAATTRSLDRPGPLVGPAGRPLRDMSAPVPTQDRTATARPGQDRPRLVPSLVGRERSEEAVPQLRKLLVVSNLQAHHVDDPVERERANGDHSLVMLDL